MRLNKTLFKIFAVLVLLTLGLTFFHHHWDGQNQHDCAVCQFIQQTVCVLALVLFAWASGLRKKSSFSVSPLDFVSLLFSSNLRGRSPPLFS